MAFRHKAVGSIEIGDQPFKNVGTLAECGADPLPLRFCDKDWHVRQRPSPLGRLSTGVLTVEHTGITEILIRTGQGMHARLIRHLHEVLDQGLPKVANLPVRPHHLIPTIL